jgi:hypothetical protein
VTGRNPGPGNSPIPEAEAFCSFMQLNINWILFMVFVFVASVRLAMIAAEAAEQLGLLRARPRAGRGNAAGPQAPGVFSTLGPWRMPGLGA